MGPLSEAGIIEEEEEEEEEEAEREALSGPSAVLSAVFLLSSPLLLSENGFIFG